MRSIGSTVALNFAAGWVAPLSNAGDSLDQQLLLLRTVVLWVSSAGVPPFLLFAGLSGGGVRYGQT